MVAEADTGKDDRGEDTTLMEPMVLGSGSRHRDEITDLALDLVQKSTGLKRSLPPHLVGSIAGLVRGMNCYYSNLIEGHDTHPIDIERALKNDYSQDPAKRDLQLEAKAHISVQSWIDAGGLNPGNQTTSEAICEIHRRFCDLLPEELLWVEDPKTKEKVRVVPGELRKRDVKVGNHLAVSAAALPRFMAHFEQAYQKLGKTEAIIATAAAHHRLLWIHPFTDGNGRVARLMSHAMLLTSLESGAVWSVARGLARNVQQYKLFLANCDLTRRNSLDGRGNLSEESLTEFTRFFLSLCIDQVNFMENLVQPDVLRARILMWAEEEIRLGKLPQNSSPLLEAILYRGEIPRGDVAGIVGTGDRQARRIVAALTDRENLYSESQRSPLRLAFPAALASRWMPGLFPEKP